MSTRRKPTAGRLVEASASVRFEDREVAFEAARALWDDVRGGLSLAPWHEPLVGVMRSCGDVRVLESLGQALALDLLRRGQRATLTGMLARRLFRPYLLSAAPRLAAAGQDPWPLVAMGLAAGAERVVDLLSLCLRDAPEQLARLAGQLAEHPLGAALLPAFLVEAALWRRLRIDSLLHLLSPSLGHADPEQRRAAARAARLAAEAQGDLSALRAELEASLEHEDGRTSETCATALALWDPRELERLVIAPSVSVRRGALMACNILARSDPPSPVALARLEAARGDADPALAARVEAALRALPPSLRASDEPPRCAGCAHVPRSLSWDDGDHTPSLDALAPEVGDQPESTHRCTACGRLYLHSSWDDGRDLYGRSVHDLRRLDPLEALAHTPEHERPAAAAALPALVAELEQTLAHPDPDAQREAAWDLARVAAARKDIDSVRALLIDPSAVVRRETLLVTQDLLGAGSELRAATDDPDPDVRTTATCLLVQAEAARGCDDGLLDALASGDSAAQVGALQAIQEHPAIAGRHALLIATQLQSVTPKTTRAARRALAAALAASAVSELDTLGELLRTMLAPQRPDILALLNDALGAGLHAPWLIAALPALVAADTEGAALRCATTLARDGHDVGPVADLLVQVVRTNVHLEAAQSLALAALPHLADPRPALLALLALLDTGWESSAAHNVSRLAREHSWAAAKDELWQALGSDSPFVREQVTQACVSQAIRGDNWSDLEQLLTHPDSDVAHAALTELAGRGGPVAPVRSAIERHLSATTPWIRTYAQQLLGLPPEGPHTPTAR